MNELIDLLEKCGYTVTARKEVFIWLMQSDRSTTLIEQRPLTAENYHHTVLKFRDRQAGVSVIFDPDDETYSYNAYCLETTLLKELFTCEFKFLDEALTVINAEFGSWETAALEKTSGCGSCAAK